MSYVKLVVREAAAASDGSIVAISRLFRLNTWVTVLPAASVVLMRLPTAS